MFDGGSMTPSSGSLTYGITVVMLSYVASVLAVIASYMQL